MKTCNPENERVKRRYFGYLKEAKRHSEASVDAAAAAIARFEKDNGHKPFSAFHIEQATRFKRRLSAAVSCKTGERLSKSTMYSTLKALRAFFIWLADQPGFRSRVRYADAEYFNLSEKEVRIAKARRPQRTPSLEQVRRVIQAMPATGPVDRRDRAVVCFTLLTGARDAATVSFKLKHVDLAGSRVIQDAREVNTKFSKTFETWFFPVGDEVLALFEAWVTYLTDDLGWGPDDPLFPRTLIGQDGERRFAAQGLDRQGWSTAARVRTIFHDAFTRAGEPYSEPHSLRRTLAILGQKVCKTPEEMKAWSQNLGHEKMMTTFTSYGQVAPDRQAEIIRSLRTRDASPAPADDLVRQMRELLERASANRPVDVGP